MKEYPSDNLEDWIEETKVLNSGPNLERIESTIWMSSLLLLYLELQEERSTLCKELLYEFELTQPKIHYLYLQEMTPHLILCTEEFG